MRAALYARVPTVDNDQNAETRLRILREHATPRGWPVTGEYVDHACAADLRGRIAWRQIWSDDEPQAGLKTNLPSRARCSSRGSSPQ